MDPREKKKLDHSSMPLVDTMNETVPSFISWCTPSIPDDIAQVRSVYKDDISASFHSIGSFLSNSGIFRDAQELAAEAFGADTTLFSVNGSTGSNFIGLYALSTAARGKAKILATRNMHKSVLHACEMFRIDIDFLPTNYDSYWHMYLPPSVEMVEDALRGSKKKYDAVLITNPTYGGLTCKLREIVEIIHDHDPDVLAYVDEAWGSHQHFTDRLPYSAMDAGADIAVQSTHKQGGSLQQSGMIHVAGDRVDLPVLQRCHTHLTTTSPSYHLLASLDAARWFLVHKGRERLNGMIDLANDFRGKINEMEGLETFGREYCDERDYALDMDLTKVQVRTVEGGFHGFELDTYLEEEMSIITEKSDAYTLMFITTFEIKRRDMLSTVSAIQEFLNTRKSGCKEKKGTQQADVPFPSTPEKGKSFPEAMRAFRKGHLTPTPFHELEGKLSGETITIYPPGIPVIVAGERFSRELIDYLDSSRKGLIEFTANDPELNFVDVIPE